MMATTTGKNDLLVKAEKETNKEEPLTDNTTELSVKFDQQSSSCSEESWELLLRDDEELEANFEKYLCGLPPPTNEVKKHTHIACQMQSRYSIAEMKCLQDTKIPLQQRFKNIIQEEGLTPIKRDLGTSNPRLEKERGHGTSSWESQYIKAMTQRGLRPRGREDLQMMQAIVKVPFIKNGNYDHGLPIWPRRSIVKSESQDPDFVNLCLDTIVRRMAFQGVFTHPKIRTDINIRRHMYDDLRNGKIYNMYKNKYYTLTQRQTSVVRHYLPMAYPDLINWLVLDTVKPHGLVDPFGAFEVSSVLCATYLMSKYMSYKREQAVANAPYIFVRKGVGAIRDTLCSIVKSLKQTYLSTMASITGKEISMWETFWLFQAVATVGYCIYRYAKSSPTLRKYADIITELHSDPHTITGHADYGPLAVTVGLASIVLPMFGLNVIRTYRSISAIYRDVGGPTTVIESCKTGVNAICQLCGLQPFFDVIDHLAIYRGIVDQADAIMNRDTLEEDIINDQSLHRIIIEILYNLEPHYRTVVSDRSLPEDIRRDFTRIRPALISLRNRVARTNRAFRDRMEPPVIWLSGPPGQGKTVLSSGIRAAVYKVLHNTNIRPTDIWTRNKATEYDDGYTGQWATYIPEIFQSTIPQVNITDGLSFIQMCDSTILPLNMSAVEQKGTVNYSSKIISVDTNGNLSNTGIHEINAIKRRQTFPLTVRKKKSIDFESDTLTIKDLDEAWELRLHEDARKCGRKVYSTACEDLDFSKSYSVSDIVHMVVREYRRRESKIPISDVFSKMQWSSTSSNDSGSDCESYSDSEGSISSSDSNDSGSADDDNMDPSQNPQSNLEADSPVKKGIPLIEFPVVKELQNYTFDVFEKGKEPEKETQPCEQVELHGMFDWFYKLGVKEDNISRLEFLKKQLQGKDYVRVDYAVQPAYDMKYGIGTHGVAFIDGTIACDYLSNVRAGLPGTSEHSSITANAKVIRTYDKVATSHILNAVEKYEGRKWGMFTGNCQDFISQMITPSYPEFITATLMEASSFVDWIRPSVGRVKNSMTVWYRIPWANEKYDNGKTICKRFPRAQDGEVYFPEFTEKYLTLKENKTAIPFNDKYLADIRFTQIKQCDAGITVRCREAGDIVTVSVRASCLSKLTKKKGPIRPVTIFGQVQLISFDPSYTETSSKGKWLAPAVKGAYELIPQPIWEAIGKVKSNPLASKVLVVGVSSVALLAFYQLFVKQIVPAMGYVYDTVLHMLGAKEETVDSHSLNRHINFQSSRAITAHSKEEQFHSVVMKYSTRLKRVAIIYKERSQKCCLYFLSSRIAAVTTHSIIENEEIHIFEDGKDCSTKYSSSQYKVYTAEGREVAYVVFERDVATVKSILTKLISRCDAKQSYSKLIRLTQTKKGTVSLSRELESAKSIAPRGLQYNTVDRGQYTQNVNDYYTTQNTGMTYGDCSVPYLVQKGTDLTLMGIHFGGLNDVAYIAPIYKDDIPEVDPGLSYKMGIDKTRIANTINSHSLIDGISYAGTLDTPLRQVTKNKIREGPLATTPLHLEGIPDLGLQKADLYGPVVPMAFRYYLGYAPIPLPEILRKIKYHDPQIFTRGLIPQTFKKVRFLTFREAILGNDVGIQALDQTTSTGPSLSLGLIPGLPRSNKRSTYFDKQEQTILPALLQRLEKNREYAEKRVVVVPIVGDSLKVELRSIEKMVEINGKQYIKPRLFGCADLLALIESKAVFGEMCKELHNQYAEGGDMVGINPMSMGWRRMEIHMREHPNIFGMDIKGCDNSHTRAEAHDFFEWANHKFFKLKKGTREYNRLEVACAALNSTYHLWKDNLYLSEGKNPSGCFLTCLINVHFVHKRLAQIFYLLQYSLFQSIDLKFEEHVRFCGFGDDNVSSVSNTVAPWFNRRTIFPMMKDVFGIICTAPDKSTDVTPFDTWETIDFLKRKWKTDGAYTWAPIEESSILKSLLFTDKNFESKQEMLQHYKQVLQGACTEYAMHGEDKFNWFVDTFKGRYESIGGVWDFRDYRYNIDKLKAGYHGTDYLYDCRV